MRKLIAIFMLVGASLTAVADDKTINVMGQANVSAVPDLFQFSLYIEEKGPVVSKLNETVTDKTNKLVSFLLKQGVKERDIQSMHVQLYPWYEHRDSGSEQKGFVLARQIQVSLRELALYDKVLDGVLKLGATRIDGFQHNVENQQDLYLSALELAVKNAQLRAEKLASSLGAKVGKVVSVSESSAYRPMAMAMESRMLMKDASGSMAGQMNIDAQVQVTFELVQ
ncbi:SIMPL domain-containing protein [Bowmanella denitrificans]|uniref:SIMPL domain-containing protein n=1 Tax=Bowmanella denitrificans TaxID=366582 RepID=A0ABN0WRM3_9ALTE